MILFFTILGFCFGYGVGVDEVKKEFQEKLLSMKLGEYVVDKAGIVSFTIHPKKECE